MNTLEAINKSLEEKLNLQKQINRHFCEEAFGKITDSRFKKLWDIRDKVSYKTYHNHIDYVSWSEIKKRQD